MGHRGVGFFRGIQAFAGLARFATRALLLALSAASMAQAAPIECSLKPARIQYNIGVLGMKPNGEYVLAVGHNFGKHENLIEQLRKLGCKKFLWGGELELAFQVDTLADAVPVVLRLNSTSGFFFSNKMKSDSNLMASFIQRAQGRLRPGVVRFNENNKHLNPDMARVLDMIKEKVKNSPKSKQAQRKTKSEAENLRHDIHHFAMHL